MSPMADGVFTAPAGPRRFKVSAEFFQLYRNPQEWVEAIEVEAWTAADAVTQFMIRRCGSLQPDGEIGLRRLLDVEPL